MRKNATYEEAITRLQEVIKELENSELTLEQSLKLFEEGTKLTSFCNTKLEQAEQKVKVISVEDTDIE